MTVTFFLVRHAAHDNLGSYLAGRLEGITLGPQGLEQAGRLAQRMRREEISEVYCSPRERTRQTAEAITSASSLAPPLVTDSLDEVDFGCWAGKTFDILDQDPSWHRWNSVRSMARTPAGETMLDVQGRIVGFLETLCAKPDGKGIVLVSHADVIKAAVSHVLGLSIDSWPRFEIAPASVTTIVLGEWGGKLITLNEAIV